MDTWVSWQQVAAQGLGKPPTEGHVFLSESFSPQKMEQESMTLETCSPAWAQATLSASCIDRSRLLCAVDGPPAAPPPNGEVA